MRRQAGAINLTELSYRYFTLEAGDVILTGTPAGVGSVKSGDIIEGEIPNVVSMSFPVIQRE